MSRLLLLEGSEEVQEALAETSLLQASLSPRKLFIAWPARRTASPNRPARNISPLVSDKTASVVSKLMAIIEKLATAPQIGLLRNFGARRDIRYHFNIPHATGSLDAGIEAELMRAFESRGSLR